MKNHHRSRLDTHQGGSLFSLDQCGAVWRFSPVLNDRTVYTVYTVYSEGPHSSIGGTRVPHPRRPRASSIDARARRSAPTRRSTTTRDDGDEASTSIDGAAVGDGPRGARWRTRTRTDGKGRAGRGGGEDAAAVVRTSTLGARARVGRATERSTMNANGDGAEARGASGTRRPLDEALGGTGRGRRAAAAAQGGSRRGVALQALRADDAALIERCLSVSDRTTIANTVAKLSSTSAMKLLSECAARAQAKPNAGERCAKWARTILLHHAGYASSAPKARATLMRLSQTIESHVSMQGSLQALLGRLELVLHASADGRGGGAERVAVEEADTMTTTVYSEATDAVDVLQDVTDAIEGRWYCRGRGGGGGGDGRRRRRGRVGRGRRIGRGRVGHGRVSIERVFLDAVLHCDISYPGPGDSRRGRRCLASLRRRRDSAAALFSLLRSNIRLIEGNRR